MTVVDQACSNLNQTREAEDSTGENEQQERTFGTVHERPCTSSAQGWSRPTKRCTASIIRRAYDIYNTLRSSSLTQRYDIAYQDRDDRYHPATADTCEYLITAQHHLASRFAHVAYPRSFFLARLRRNAFKAKDSVAKK